MAAELKSGWADSGVAVSVGERVTLNDSGAEYVVLSVNHSTGRLELLRLMPWRVETDIPLDAVRRTQRA